MWKVIQLSKITWCKKIICFVNVNNWWNVTSRNTQTLSGQSHSGVMSVCLCAQVPCAVRDPETWQARRYGVPQGSRIYRCPCFGQERLQDVFLYIQRGAVPHQGSITHSSLCPDLDICLSFVFTSPLNSSPQVTFRNVVSGEHLYYLVTFEATSPGILSTVKLVAAVRQRTSATVQVENPLTSATCLTTDCKCPDISAPPQHTVPGQSKVDT